MRFSRLGRAEILELPSLASQNTLELILLVLVVVSLALAVFEMIQIRKLRGKPPQQTPPGGSPPKDDL